MRNAVLSHPPRDVHRALTEKIIAAIEKGPGTFVCPWHHSQAAFGRPRNALTGKPYRGINVLSLWVDAIHKNYDTGYWASYRQWQELGAQVRRKEHGSLVVLWKPLDAKVDEDEEESSRRFVTRGFSVFNAVQVEGWSPPEEERPRLVERIARAEEVVANTKAVIREGRYAFAQYRPDLDVIEMPARSAFNGSTTSTPTESFYSTLFHELCHWTGHKTRLARDLRGRFGDEAYAMEELVAELGAAFLSADLAISPEPREDHATYLATWLKVLMLNPRALMAASAKACAAEEYVLSFSETRLKSKLNPSQ